MLGGRIACFDENPQGIIYIPFFSVRSHSPIAFFELRMQRHSLKCQHHGRPSISTMTSMALLLSPQSKLRYAQSSALREATAFSGLSVLSLKQPSLA